MQIYLARNNQQAGPYTLDQVNEMLANQQVLLTDLAWHQGMTEWKALGELTQGQLVYQPSGYVAAQTEQKQQSFHNSIVTEKPAKVRAAAVNKRIFAKLVDIGLFVLPSIIFTLLYIPVQELQKASQLGVDEQLRIAEAMQKDMPTWMPILLLAYTFGLLFLQNYFIARSGQSIGKKIFHLQIVDINTNQLAPQWRSFFIRSLLFVVLSQLMSIFPVLILVFVADVVLFFSKGNDSLHDRLAKTKVIDISK